MENSAYRETYQGLRAELQASEHDGIEDELEQLDVDAMLHFAGQLLAKPERWWADASPEDKVRLQRALFPDGLLVNSALEITTDPNSRDSVTYLLFGGGQTIWRPHGDRTACKQPSTAGFPPMSRAARRDPCLFDSLTAPSGWRPHGDSP